jgi:hypothetical protein
MPRPPSARWPFGFELTTWPSTVCRPTTTTFTIITTCTVCSQAWAKPPSLPPPTSHNDVFHASLLAYTFESHHHPSACWNRHGLSDDSSVGHVAINVGHCGDVSILTIQKNGFHRCWCSLCHFLEWSARLAETFCRLVVKGCLCIFQALPVGCSK